MINALAGWMGAVARTVTLLAELVRASQRVGATAARRVKVQELASLLKSLTPDEIDIGVHYLSGEIPQGKIGIGYSAVRAAAATPPRHRKQLSITEVDQRLADLAAIRGSGSAARRAEALKSCSLARRGRSSSFCCGS